jgi:hypothetical protein
MLLQQVNGKNIAELLAFGFQSLLKSNQAFNHPQNLTPEIYEKWKNRFFLCALLFGQFTDWIRKRSNSR